MSNDSEVSHPMASGRSKSRKAGGLAGAQEKLKELEQEDKKKEASKRKTFEQKELVDLKDLVFLGFNSEVFEFGGYKFEISTLTNEEKRKVISELAKRGKEMAAFVKVVTLALAIRTINSVDLLELYNSDEDLSDFEKRIAIVDSLQSSLIAYLFNKYEKLADKSDAFFKTEDDRDENEDKLKK